MSKVYHTIQLSTKTCKTCGIEKPLDEMVRRSDKPHLYRSLCKSCKNKQRRDETVERQCNAPPPPPLTHRVCRDCGVEKPVTDMKPDKGYVNDVGTLCFMCDAKQQRDRRAKQRAANPLPAPKDTKVCTKCGQELPKSMFGLVRKGKPWLRPTCSTCAKDVGHRYRARKYEATIEHVDLQAIIQRDGYICHLCNKAIDPTLSRGPMSLAFDHVIPLSRGGEHSMTNIRPAHFSCNCRKKNKLPSELSI